MRCTWCWPLLVLFTAAVGCAPLPPKVHHPGLEKPRFLRTNLRPDGQTLWSANYLALEPSIRAGTSATVTEYRSDQVSVTINQVEYEMRPGFGDSEWKTDSESINGFLDKYFVDRQKDLRIEAMQPAELKDDVILGKYIIGMSKQQVYTSLGPPAMIEQEIPAANLPLARIMESDRWIYPQQAIMWAFPTYLYFSFIDGQLAQVK